MAEEFDPLSIQSLSVVQAELYRAQASHEQRRSSVESKAGLILGAAGVVVGLKGSDSSVLSIVSQVLAAVAGIGAVWALWPRVGSALSPMKFRQRHLNKAPERAQLVALDTQLLTLEDDEQRLRVKACRFKWAAALLALAVVVALAGSILKAVQGSDTTHRQECITDVSGAPEPRSTAGRLAGAGGPSYSPAAARPRVDHQC